jgi:hypothetical protein
MSIWHKVNSQYWYTVSLFHQTCYDSYLPIFFLLSLIFAAIIVSVLMNF